MALIPLPMDDVLLLSGRLEQEGDLVFADRILLRALEAVPEWPEALHLSGIVAFRLGRRGEAVEKLERAIVTGNAKGSDIRLFFRNIAEVYRAVDRFDDAVSAGKKAVALWPDDPISLYNLAVIHYHRLELDACINAAERALALNGSLPGPHFQLAEALLLRGEWERGWHEYQWRFNLPGNLPLMPPTDKPRWDGTPLHDGTLLVIADQGFGDEIQFSRYIPWAAELCGAISVACAPEMMSVLRQVHPAARLFSEWSDCPPFHAFRAMSGLPGLHQTRPDSIPGTVPYLRADPDRVLFWKERLDRLTPSGVRRIGIVWAGRPSHNNDRWRSASLRSFAPLAAVPGIALVSLQKGPAAEQAGQYFGAAPLINLGAEITDFGDTMGIMAALDLVVTVDTSVGHLAGAMGRPAFIMLARAPDWRWLLDRSDTPWYPTVRLVRQTTTGAWDDVMATIAASVTAFIGKPRAV